MHGIPGEAQDCPLSLSTGEGGCVRLGWRLWRAEYAGLRAYRRAAAAVLRASVSVSVGSPTLSAARSGEPCSEQQVAPTLSAVQLPYVHVPTWPPQSGLPPSIKGPWILHIHLIIKK